MPTTALKLTALCYPLKLFQASDRHHKYAIGAAVGTLPHCGKHHFERRSKHTVCINFAFKLFQCGRTIFNQFFPTQLYFHQTVVTVSQMHYGITFQTILVSEMIDIPIQDLRIHAQIASRDRRRKANRHDRLKMLYPQVAMCFQKKQSVVVQKVLSNSRSHLILRISTKTLYAS